LVVGRAFYTSLPHHLRKPDTIRTPHIATTKTIIFTFTTTTKTIIFTFTTTKIITFTFTTTKIIIFITAEALPLRFGTGGFAIIASHRWSPCCIALTATFSKPSNPLRTSPAEWPVVWQGFFPPSRLPAVSPLLKHAAFQH